MKLPYIFRFVSKKTLMRRELENIRNAMPIAIKERDRLKRNKKRHQYLTDLIAQNRTRQLELERALKL